MQRLTNSLCATHSQFYFAALLYSFAHHLRRNTYRSLPLSRSQPVPSSSSSRHPSNAAYSSVPLDGEDYELDDEGSDSFYAHGTPGTPLSSTIPGINSASSSSQQQSRAKSHRTSLSLDKRRNGAGGSPGNFADFVSAPPPGRRAARTAGGPGTNGPQRGSLLGNGNGVVVAGSSRSGSGASVSGSGSASGGSVDGDVVFDSTRDEGDMGIGGRR